MVKSAPPPLKLGIFDITPGRPQLEKDLSVAEDQNNEWDADGEDDVEDTHPKLWNHGYSLSHIRNETNLSAAVPAHILLLSERVSRHLPIVILNVTLQSI